MSNQNLPGKLPIGSVAGGTPTTFGHLDGSAGTTGRTGVSSERGAYKWVRWVGVGAASVSLTLGLTACNGDADGDDGHTPAAQESSTDGGEGNEGSGEHGGGEGSEGAEGGLGEESGRRLALTDTFDQVRAGTRLILVYDPAANAFTGTVENTTTGVLDRVRVEVHLSNGVELGPTTPLDLDPGEIVNVNLPATDAPFDGWSPHAEVGGGGAEGSGEHGVGGEGTESSEGAEDEGTEGSQGE